MRCFLTKWEQCLGCIDVDHILKQLHILIIGLEQNKKNELLATFTNISLQDSKETQSFRKDSDSFIYFFSQRM